VELMFLAFGILVGWVASAAFYSWRVNKIMWGIAALDRKVGLLVSHLAPGQRLPNWQKLAIDPSSSKLQVAKAYMAETGASLAEAKTAVENGLSASSGSHGGSASVSMRIGVRPSGSDTMMPRQKPRAVPRCLTRRVRHQRAHRVAGGLDGLAVCAAGAAV